MTTPAHCSMTVEADLSTLTLSRQDQAANVGARTAEGLRVLRLAVAAVALHRGAALTVVLAGGVGFRSASMAIAYAAFAVWSSVLVWASWRLGFVRREFVALDLAVAVTVGVLALSWGPSGMSFGYRVLQGAAIVAGLALSPRSLAFAVTALVGVKFLAVVVPPEPWDIGLAEFAVYAATLAALALAAAAARRLLSVAAQAVDRRAAVASAPDSGHPDLQRVVHDTALATLTAIANGALDAKTDAIRARCAREAAYLRLTIEGGHASHGGLPVALAAAVADATAIGLRVHPMIAAVPADLDGRVLSALEMAVREALNNVRRHAGSGEAWLSAGDENGQLVVRVVDRGAGFTLAATSGSTGINESIHARMREVGGVAMVESSVGSGTCVELRWPA
jgi:signal transduction histidine kinase